MNVKKSAFFPHTIITTIFTSFWKKYDFFLFLLGLETINLFINQISESWCFWLYICNRDVGLILLLYLNLQRLIYLVKDQQKDQSPTHPIFQLYTNICLMHINYWGHAIWFGSWEVELQHFTCKCMFCHCFSFNYAMFLNQEAWHCSMEFMGKYIPQQNLAF